MSTNPPEVFLNENGTQVYLKNCKHHGLGYHYMTIENNKSRYRCCECLKEYRKNKNTNKIRQIRTQKIINYMGGKCVICGYNKSNYAMECHHENPNEKEYTIAKFKKRKWKTILKEIEKCVLVCSNCHRNIHINKKSIYKHRKKYRKLIYHFNNEKCFICNDKNIYNASYHHIDQTKKLFNISEGICKGYSLERIIEENKKCVLLCENCHREYHSGEFHQDIKFKTTFNNELYQEYLKNKRKGKIKKERKKREPKNICVNCGKRTNNKKYCSDMCSRYDSRKVKEMNSEILTKLIKTNTYQQIGDMYGVSGNAVKKWCIRYNVEYIDKRKLAVSEGLEPPGRLLGTPVSLAN